MVEKFPKLGAISTKLPVNIDEIQQKARVFEIYCGLLTEEGLEVAIKKKLELKRKSEENCHVSPKRAPNGMALRPQDA